MNLEEKRRANETCIKVRILGGLWRLFGWTNFKIIKISDGKGKISDPTGKREIAEISDFLGRGFFSLVHSTSVRDHASEEPS
jgi:hypothetical protein